MSVPLDIARDNTPLLAPIERSIAPIVTPSAVEISCIRDKIVLMVENNLLKVLMVENYLLSLQRVQNRTRAKDTKKGANVQILKLKEDERKYRDKGMGDQRFQG